MAKRKAPGETGQGRFFHISILPKRRFFKFRTHDVGKKGGIERVAGHSRKTGWKTQKWIVDKDMAIERGGYLLPVSIFSVELFKTFPKRPKRVKGDIYTVRY